MSGLVVTFFIKYKMFLLSLYVFFQNEAEEIYKGLLGSKPLHLTPPYGHEDGR